MVINTRVLAAVDAFLLVAGLMAVPAVGGSQTEDRVSTNAGRPPAADAASGDLAAETDAVPPADGVYQDKVRSEGSGPNSQPRESEVAVKITTLSRTATEVRQKRETESGDRSGGPTGFGGGGEGVWRGDGVWLQTGGDAAAGGGGKVSYSCDPPEQLEVKLPLATGVTWTNKADCTLKSVDGSYSGKLHVESTSKVLGSKVIEVAGARVFVWEVQTAGKANGTFSYQGRDEAFDSTTDTVSNFAPRVGRIVKSDGTTKTNSSMGPTTTKVSTVAINLKPE